MTRSEFVCSCLIFIFLVCVCLHTLYISYIAIIYTCMSWGQNLSAHDDFMIANHAWTLCLFTHIYRPWGQILSAHVYFCFTNLTVCLHTCTFIDHAHEVPWWTCDYLFCLNLGVCLQVYIYRSCGQNLSAHVYAIICMCFAEFYLVCNSCIRFY